MTRSDRSQCSHEPYGCGGSFHDSEMHMPSKLCKECALTLARRLRVSLADLPLGIFAAHQARAGRPDLIPGEADVWPILERLNKALPELHRVELQDKYIPVPTLPRNFIPSDACLPEGDRAAA